MSVIIYLPLSIYTFFSANTQVWALHFSRVLMSSSHGTTEAEEFLDGLKPGWGTKYGPTLAAAGFEDLGDAQDLSEVELNDLLGCALRTVGAPALHVARIIKRLFLINNKQGHATNPYSYLHFNHKSYFLP
jgi:hypothetical protein